MKHFKFYLTLLGGLFKSSSIESLSLLESLNTEGNSAGLPTCAWQVSVRFITVHLESRQHCKAQQTHGTFHRTARPARLNGSTAKKHHHCPKQTGLLIGLRSIAKFTLTNVERLVLVDVHLHLARVKCQQIHFNSSKSYTNALCYLIRGGQRSSWWSRSYLLNRAIVPSLQTIILLIETLSKALEWCSGQVPPC